MTRFAALLGLLLASVCASCAASPSDTVAHGDADLEQSPTVFDPTRFAISAGSERLEQHRSWRSSDIATGQKRSLNLQNAYWLAKLSALAYLDGAELRSHLTDLGLPSDDDHFRFFESKRTDAQAFYVTTSSLSVPPALVPNPLEDRSREIAVLVFRGTEPDSVLDILDDIDLFPNTDAFCGGAVHSGFYDAMASLWNEEGLGTFIKEHHSFEKTGDTVVRAGAELYLTGHSLGGAMAGLALAQTMTDATPDPCGPLPTKYVPVSGLYTFGMPRVATKDLATRITTVMQDRTPIFRVVNGGDPVPQLMKGAYMHLSSGGRESEYEVHIQQKMPTISVSQGVTATFSVNDHIPAELLESLSSLLGRP